MNNASPYVTTFSGGDESAAPLGRFTMFNSKWTAISSVGIPDGNADGVANDPAIAALGQSNVTGQIKVQVRDAVSGALITKIGFLSSEWTALSLAVMDDANGDGISDDPALAVVARKNDLSRNVLAVRSMTDGSLLGKWSAHKPTWNITAAVGAQQADGQALVAMVGTDPARGISRIEYRRISDGGKFSTFVFGTEATVKDMVFTNDSNHDGISDDPAVGVLAINANATGRMRFRSVADGTIVKEFQMVGSEWHPRKAAAMGDISQNGVPEIISLAEDDDSQALIKVRDYASTDTLMNIWP
jgi:hypothetical protein